MPDLHDSDDPSSSDREYESDEAPDLGLNLQRLRDLASAALSAPCTSVQKFTRGLRHEIFTLHFSSGDHLQCIARVVRPPLPLSDPSSYAVSAKYISAKLQSEVDTMRYVSSHTSVPVPEVFLVCKDADGGGVGAPFILIQHIPGRHLYKLWPSLPLEHKMCAVWQIAEVVAQLGALEFEAIGSLRAHASGGSGETQTKVGELIHTTDDSPHMSSDKTGPFRSTIDYLVSFMNRQHPAVLGSRRGDLIEIQERIGTFLEEGKDLNDFRSPFGLQHADLDGQNVLFVVGEGDDKAPKLSGIIDWEYAQTAPRYFIYDYPIFIQINPWEKQELPVTKRLQQHFARGVLHYSPRAAAPTALCSFRRRLPMVNRFVNAFMLVSNMDPEMADCVVEDYLTDLKDPTCMPYEDWSDYEEDALDLGHLTCNRNACQNSSIA